MILTQTIVNLGPISQDVKTDGPAILTMQIFGVFHFDLSFRRTNSLSQVVIIHEVNISANSCTQL